MNKIPSTKNLQRANGVIAPQVFDEEENEWVFTTGRDGALHVIDHDRSKNYYKLSREGYPALAKDGDVVLFLDTGEIKVYYKNEWWDI